MNIKVEPAIARWINIVALAALAIGLVAAILTHSNENRTRMSQEQMAWSLIDEGALILDVRTKAEFDAGHLEGALHIPHTEIGDRFAELGENKSRPVVLYCKAGGRAGKAEQVLEANGFTKLHNAGGYDAIMAAKES